MPGDEYFCLQQHEANRDDNGESVVSCFPTVTHDLCCEVMLKFPGAA